MFSPGFFVFEILAPSPFSASMPSAQSPSCPMHYSRSPVGRQHRPASPSSLPATSRVAGWSARLANGPSGRLRAPRPKAGASSLPAKSTRRNSRSAAAFSANEHVRKPTTIATEHAARKSPSEFHKALRRKPASTRNMSLPGPPLRAMSAARTAGCPGSRFCQPSH